MNPPPTNGDHTPDTNPMAIQTFDFPDGEPVPSCFAISGMPLDFQTTNAHFRSSEEWHNAQLSGAFAASDRIRHRAELSLKLEAVREKTKEHEQAEKAQKELAEAEKIEQQRQAAKAKAQAATAKLQAVKAQAAKLQAANEQAAKAQAAKVQAAKVQAANEQAANEQAAKSKGQPNVAQKVIAQPVPSPQASVHGSTQQGFGSHVQAPKVPVQSTSTQQVTPQRSAAQVPIQPGHAQTPFVQAPSLASRVSTPSAQNGNSQQPATAPKGQSFQFQVTPQQPTAQVNPFRVATQAPTTKLVTQATTLQVPLQNTPSGPANLVMKYNPFTPAATPTAPTAHAQGQGMQTSESWAQNPAPVPLSTAWTQTAPLTEVAWDGSDPMKNPDLKNEYSVFTMAGQSHPTIFNRKEYHRVHAEMKKIRAIIQKPTAEGRRPSPQFIRKCNEMRRQIQLTVGQLTPENEQIVQCINKVIAILREARADQSESYYVANFSVSKRDEIYQDELQTQPLNYGETMSFQLIYLLAAFVKIVVAQWTNEASQDGTKAEPIGRLAVRIFSEPDFFWRGQTLIDMLLAKIWRVCPILFGARAHPRDDAGKAILGWRQRGGRFISAAEHYDRMAGIAAGFASISLREFSRSRLVSPYPPWNYWFALSTLLSTSPRLTSATTYIVIRALLKDHMGLFIKFYGNFAMSAIVMAIIEFPSREPSSDPHQQALANLVHVFEQGTGVNFRTTRFDLMDLDS